MGTIETIESAIDVLAQLVGRLKAKGLIAFKTRQEFFEPATAEQAPAAEKGPDVPLSHLENRIEKQNADFEAVKKEEPTEMPPIYQDGSFRTRHTGLMEHRFMLNGVQTSVTGRAEQDCYRKRFDKTVEAEIKKRASGGASTAPNKSALLFGAWLKDWYDRQI